MGRRRVDWRSDAQTLVKEVKCGEEPCGWDSRYGILFLQDLFTSNQGWSLQWVPRASNNCADIAAEWARMYNCNIAMFDHFADALLFSILNCIIEEMTCWFLQL